MKTFDWRKPVGKKEAIREVWGKHTPPLLHFLVENAGDLLETVEYGEQPKLTMNERKLINNTFFDGDEGEVTFESPFIDPVPMGSVIVTVKNAKRLSEEIIVNGKDHPLISVGPAPLGDPRHISFIHRWAPEEAERYRQAMREARRKWREEIEQIFEATKTPDMDKRGYQVYVWLFWLGSRTGPFNRIFEHLSMVYLEWWVKHHR